MNKYNQKKSNFSEKKISTAVVICFVLLLFPQNLFSFSIFDLPPSKPEYSGEFGIKVSNLGTDELNSSAILHFNWFGFQVDTGAEFASSHINFTFDTLFTPFSTDKFQTGVRLINHTNFYFLEFMEYDFLPGFFVNFIPSEKFSVSGCFLWQIKSATIYELQINEKSIINTCPAFELKFNYKFSEKIKSSVKISSFDLFTYHLFLSPVLNISGTYVINQSFSVKLEEQIISVDYFTLSANLNEFSTRISVNWRL